MIKMPKRRVKKQRDAYKLAAAKKREISDGTVKPDDPTRNTDELRKLAANLKPYRSNAFADTVYWLNGVEIYTLPDGRHVSINDGYIGIGNERYTPTGAYNVISNMLQTPTSNLEGNNEYTFVGDMPDDDDGGLGPDFLANNAKMKEQEREIGQLTDNLSRGDPTVNAAAQLFVGATGNVGQIGNNQQVRQIAFGGKRSRKYRKRKSRNKKSKRRYRRASGKSKV